MNIPRVPADDQCYTLDAELGYNSRGELAQCSTIEFACNECGTTYELDVAAAIPTSSVVVNDNSAEHAHQLRTLIDTYRYPLPPIIAQALTELVDSWHREG